MPTLGTLGHAHSLKGALSFSLGLPFHEALVLMTPLAPLGLLACLAPT